MKKTNTVEIANDELKEKMGKVTVTIEYNTKDGEPKVDTYDGDAVMLITAEEDGEKVGVGVMKQGILNIHILRSLISASISNVSDLLGILSDQFGVGTALMVLESLSDELMAMGKEVVDKE